MADYGTKKAPTGKKGEESRKMRVKMVEQMGASAEAAFLPFFKLKKPQKRHFLLKSNIHNGTFSHAFLKRKMEKNGPFTPFFREKWEKNGEVFEGSL